MEKYKDEREPTGLINAMTINRESEKKKMNEMKRVNEWMREQIRDKEKEIETEKERHRNIHKHKHKHSTDTERERYRQIQKRKI